jgi:hypothetical protein
LTHSHRYSVKPEELLLALVDPAYLHARQARFGGVGDPKIEQGDAQVVITSERQLPMEKIPGIAKGFVGDGRITQVDTWRAGADIDGHLSGDWQAVLGTAPAEIGGDYRITPDPDGSMYEVDVRVKVKVPFFGGKLEGQVLGYLDAIISKEQVFLDDWLGGDRPGKAQA